MRFPRSRYNTRVLREWREFSQPKLLHSFKLFLYNLRPPLYNRSLEQDERKGTRGLTRPTRKGRPKSEGKSWKLLYAFVNNFSVYNCQLRIAISPRFLTQSEWNRPWWKAKEVIFHMTQVESNLVLPFGTYGQKLQRMKVETVSTASKKWLLLTYYPMT